MTTNNTENAGGVTITEGDERIAADVLDSTWQFDPIATWAQAIAEVRIAARQAALEEAAKVAEAELVDVFDDSPEVDAICNAVVREIAAQIRTLSTKEVEG